LLGVVMTSTFFLTILVGRQRAKQLYLLSGKQGAKQYSVCYTSTQQVAELSFLRPLA
jgi:hypothetical protein